MAINVADNFSYKGGKPLDNRTKYSTIASMVATPAADLYDGCLAYVTSTKKNYQYDSTNTVDENLGKWRELQTGGSGEGIPAGGSAGQVLAKKTGTDYDVEWVNDQTADTSKCYKYDDSVTNTIEDEDYFPYYNVSVSEKQQSTWTNIKSVLKTYFDQYYSGGGGGTSNYNDLTNKPQIAGVTLSGNQSLASFGLTSSVEAQSSGGTTKSYVNTGEKYNWNTGNTCYGTCATSAATTAKSITLARGTLNFTAGARIAIKFSYTNTASAPTLTVNGTVKNIKYIDADGNVSTPLIWWNAGDIVEFTYDGTQWLMQPTMQMLFSGQGTKIPRESIYSTSEKVVGCWTDGRPIYQKTITGTAPSTANTAKYYAIGATVSTMVKATFMLYDGAGNYLQFEGVNLISSSFTSNTITGVKSGITNNSATSNKNSAFIVCNNSSWLDKNVYITVQYTKTTDSANSFNYGDPNDYSTTEKIVGSWIDGKPLYEKTISCGTLPNNDTKTIAHNVNNLKTIIKTEGFSVKTDGKTIYFPYYTPSSGNAFVEVAASTSTTSIRINTYGWDSSMGVTNFTTTYVTIQYTKTTD